MNIATDLIAREHEEIAASIDAFEAKPHRSRALELCVLAERHSTMIDDVVHPLLAGIDQHRLRMWRKEHEERSELIDRIRHASDRSELRSLVAGLADELRRHGRREEDEILPAMEDDLGVARMNQLGMSLLEWQHDDARRRRESEDELDDLLAMTRADLYERAQEVDLDGRSTMRKAELAQALAEM